MWRHAGPLHRSRRTRTGSGTVEGRSRVADAGRQQGERSRNALRRDIAAGTPVPRTAPRASPSRPRSPAREPRRARRDRDARRRVPCPGSSPAAAAADRSDGWRCAGRGVRTASPRPGCAGRTAAPPAENRPRPASSSRSPTPPNMKRSPAPLSSESGVRRGGIVLRTSTCSSGRAAGIGQGSRRRGSGSVLDAPPHGDSLPAGRCPERRDIPAALRGERTLSEAAERVAVTIWRRLYAAVSE